MYPDTPHAADPEFEEQQPGVISGDRKTNKDQWRQPVQDHFTPEQPIEEKPQQKQVVECCKKGDRNRTDVKPGVNQEAGHRETFQRDYGTCDASLPSPWSSVAQRLRQRR